MAWVLGLVVALLLVAPVARADAPPSKDGIYRPICPEPAGFECITGGRSKADVAGDPCTSAELQRLGFRFQCEEGHNDRVTAYWCRPKGARRPVPPGLHEELTAGSYADDHAFQTFHGRSIERANALRAVDAEVPANVASLEAMAREVAANREPCKRLAAKYMRCGLETETCRATWIKMGLVDGGVEDAGESDARVDAGADGGVVSVAGADAGTSSRAPSRCGCTLVGHASGSCGPLGGLAVILAIAVRRSRRPLLGRPVARARR